MSQREATKIYKEIARQERKYEKTKSLVEKRRIIKKTLALEKRFNLLMGKEQREI